jgi:hypothetical protein
MGAQKNGYSHEPATGCEEEELSDAARPIVLVVTRAMEALDLEMDQALCQLANRFDIRLVQTPSLALAMSRIARANEGNVVLLLSDMLTSGTEVFLFISTFSQDWPDAGYHLIDAMEGRVIFSDPKDPDSDQSPSIQIESNGRDPLDTCLAAKMVERYFPEG